MLVGRSFEWSCERWPAAPVLVSAARREGRGGEPGEYSRIPCSHRGRSRAGDTMGGRAGDSALCRPTPEQAFGDAPSAAAEARFERIAAQRTARPVPPRGPTPDPAATASLGSGSDGVAPAPTATAGRVRGPDPMA